MTEATRYEFNLRLDDEKGSAYLAQMVGRGKRVLEVGCAAGSVTRMLKNDLQCTVTGIEIDATAAEKARQLYEEVLIANIEELDLEATLKGRRFDVVTFGDVLEHLRDPLATLRRVKPCIAEGGYVVASVPNVAHASVAFELANGRFDYRRLGLLDDTHIRFFTKRSLLALFEDAGYLVIELRRAECDPAETEFHTRALDAADRAVLEYFFARNPEARTYQFVAKAVPVEGLPTALVSDAVAARERLDALERETAAQTDELRRLRSQIAWLDTRWPRPWLRRVGNLFNRKPGD